jgi:hypothetical protein
MKILRPFIFLLLASLVAPAATAGAKGAPDHSPSLLDMPEKGLYYGFIMNNSSTFIEVSIRQRNDIVEDGQAGGWKTFIVVLDKEYVEDAKGPFTLEIEDD